MSSTAQVTTTTPAVQGPANPVGKPSKSSLALLSPTEFVRQHGIRSKARSSVIIPDQKTGESLKVALVGRPSSRTAEGYASLAMAQDAEKGVKVALPPVELENGRKARDMETLSPRNAAFLINPTEDE